VEERGMADDIQYAGGRCGYGMAYDRLHDYPRTPACGWRKRGQENEALGRSLGGFTTKIHAACDSHGNPLRFILTGGQASDYTQALALIDGMRTDALLADKGYDADYMLEAAENMGAIAVIPPKSNRKMPRTYDEELYKERNLIERLFNKLKHFRRIATRYDKTAASFMAWLHIAAIYLWLK
ncbi:MAG: IS5 family transposase, partial [Rickettsiales bacterium]|nr:IS5 family transposase [Rickettsiales bacterium]